MADKWGVFRATAAVSIPVSAISCNQTLATILTDQLCRLLATTRQERAIHLENSVILIAALVPWSIACSVPCATLGVGMECLPYALYLYLVPVLNGLARENRTPVAVPGRSWHFPSTKRGTPMDVIGPFISFLCAVLIGIVVGRYISSRRK